MLTEIQLNSQKLLTKVCSKISSRGKERQMSVLFSCDAVLNANVGFV